MKSMDPAFADTTECLVRLDKLYRKIGTFGCATNAKIRDEKEMPFCDMHF